MNEVISERRRHQRFTLDEKCLIRHSAVVGTVDDLSLGGLSCRCSTSGDYDSSVCKKVDLFFKDNKIWVRDLAMEVVESEMIPGKFLENFWIRKCRGRFSRLREEQTAQLKDLIITTFIQ